VDWRSGTEAVHHFQNWGGRWDSNPRRPESQSGALPTELRPPSSRPSINRLRRCSPTRRADGAPGRTRTCDPRLRRPMLYPAELRAPRVRDPDGRGRGIRTPDPLLPKQMRYQTAPCPALLRPAGRRDPGRIRPRVRTGARIIRTPPWSVNLAATSGKSKLARPLRASSRLVPRDIEKSPFPRDRMPAFFGT
jgi:hypothetical protein